MHDRLREVARTFVAVAAVREHKAADVRELRYGEIRCHGGLFALARLDSDAYSKCLIRFSFASPHSAPAFAACIMATSLPPSPIAATIAGERYFFSSFTSCAFCSGEQRQQTTLVHAVIRSAVSDS